MDQIRIRGARTHNLKNLNVDLPRNRLIVITGLSGSGKSSLAFDRSTRRGSAATSSRSRPTRASPAADGKADVDLIEGLSPAISIEQKAASHNPRSTVGTITEIHDYCACSTRASHPLLPAAQAPCRRSRFRRWWITRWRFPRTPSS